MNIVLLFCCFSIIYKQSTASPAAFKILSEFIEHNAKSENDDVTGLKLKSDDVTNQINNKKTSEDVLDGVKEHLKVTPPVQNVEEEISKEPLHENEAPDEDVIYSRLRLPKFDAVKENQTFSTLLPGDVEANVTVLSVSPFIFEVDGLLDTEECDLLVAIAKGKGMKIIRQQFSHLKLSGVDKLFRDWDYNQDGFISHDEVLLVPNLSDLKMDAEQVDDMFFMLKMDPNKDGKVDLNELKSIDLSTINNYVTQLRYDPSRLRNVTFDSSWVWADEDDMLKYEKNGYFEDYHARLSTLTEMPSILWEMSEPLQIRHYGPEQFQTHRHDSEAPNKDLPCCLYGDQDKSCRICRYLSFTLFLNDVEDGGEMVFPLANNPFNDIMKNSGEWHGYYLYSKTTGSKTFFTVDIQFTEGENNNGTFIGSGRENDGEFEFRNAVIEGETIKFEKVYKSTESSDGEKTGDEQQAIRYHGKIIEQTQIMGYWWVPGNQRMNGRFFMWNRDFEIYSARAVDQTNRNEGCLKAPLKIKPKKGKAVFWYNHHLNPLNDMVGPLNHEAIFAHCEVNQGVKWTASSWLNIIGDGELKLRTWRRGTNLMHDRKRMRDIYRRFGTNEPKREIEEYEKDFYEEIHGKKKTGNGTDPTKDSGYKYKQSSNALKALNLLVNDLSNEQLAIMAANVHRILGLQCV